MRMIGILGVAVAGVIVSYMYANTQAFGGWISGGGKIRKDADNPWFLANTNSVSWCFERDAANFSLPDAQVKALVEKGLSFWKKELTTAMPIAGGLPVHQMSRLATQTFQHVSCNGQEDIKFLFGKATPDLIDYLAVNDESPSDYIGLAVRTDYDQSLLKGRGFIYVAPDVKGALYYPRSNKTKEGVWSLEEGIFLQAVINHELGHVFGLSHKDSGFFGRLGSISLMGESFPELASSGASWLTYLVFPRLFQSETKELYESCFLSAKVRKFLALGPDVKCLRASLPDISGGEFRLEVGGSGTAWRSLGAFEFLRGVNGWARPAVSIWLSEHQQVIRDDAGNLLKDRGFPVVAISSGMTSIGIGKQPETNKDVLLIAQREAHCAELTLETGPYDQPLVISLTSTLVDKDETGRSICNMSSVD